MKIRFIIRIDDNILFAKQRKLNGAECSLLKKAPKTNQKAIFRCNDLTANELVVHYCHYM